jgi:hypothetical protein
MEREENISSRAISYFISSLFASKTVRSAETERERERSQAVTRFE